MKKRGAEMLSWGSVGHDLLVIAAGCLLLALWCILATVGNALLWLCSFPARFVGWVMRKIKFG